MELHGSLNCTLNQLKLQIAGSSHVGYWVLWKSHGHNLLFSKRSFYEEKEGSFGGSQSRSEHRPTVLIQIIGFERATSVCLQCMNSSRPHSQEAVKLSYFKWFVNIILSHWVVETDISYLEFLAEIVCTWRREKSKPGMQLRGGCLHSMR